MKKKISIFLALLLCITTFSACGKNPQGVNVTGSEIPMNPFDIEQADKATNQVGGYSFGMRSEIGEFTFDGNEVSIPLFVENRDVKQDIGFMVFLDGVPQEINGETLSRFDFDVNEKKDIDLCFMPSLGKKGETHSLQIFGIVKPSFTPTGENKNFGNNHNLMEIMPCDLKFAINAKDVQVQGATSTNLEPIDEDFLREKLKIVLQEGTNNHIRLYNPKDYESPAFTYDKNELNLKLCGLGEDELVYRTTIFVDHKPVLINGKNTYVDIQVKPGSMNVYDVKLNTKDFKENSFIYAICTPVDIKSQYPIKTASKLLIHTDISKNKAQQSSSANVQSSNLSNEYMVIAGLSSGKLYGVIENELCVVDIQTNTILAKTALPQNMFGQKWDVLNDGIALITSILPTDVSTEKSEDGFSSTTPGGELQTICKVYDSKLKLISEINISQYDKNIRFEEFCISKDGKQIAYVKNHNSICVADLDFGQEKVLLTLQEGRSDMPSFIMDIRFAQDAIVYTGGNYINKKDLRFYGKVGLNGINKVHRDDGIDYPQTANGISLWRDQHVELEKSTSGIVKIMDGDKNYNVSTKEALESGDAYLSTDGKSFATYLLSEKDGKAVYTLRSYQLPTGKLLNTYTETLGVWGKCGIFSVVVGTDEFFVSYYENEIIRTVRYAI